MGKIANEMYVLVDLLDESIDLFIKRLDFVRCGDLGKVKFIDERIEPIIWQNINRQADKISIIFKNLTIKNKK
jgi:hypothetical protein